MDGNLALSRALGDRYFKSNPTLPPHKQKVRCLFVFFSSPARGREASTWKLTFACTQVIAVPDITQTDAEEGDLLLLACDGLYEVSIPFSLSLSFRFFLSVLSRIPSIPIPHLAYRYFRTTSSLANR